MPTKIKDNEILNSRIPDEDRPPPRAALPFRITREFDGIHMEWQETHAVGYGGKVEQKTMPMRCIGNDLISFGRIAHLILRLMEMYREVERENEHLTAENERLAVQLIDLEGQRIRAENNNRPTGKIGRPPKG